MAPNLILRIFVVVLIDLSAIMLIAELLRFRIHREEDLITNLEKKHPGFSVFLATGLVAYANVLVFLAMWKPKS